MNKLLLLIFLSSFAGVADAQVKIGSLGTPNTNAVLELDGGTNKGLLLPRLSAPQIAALTTAPDGLLVYNNTDGFLYIRKVGTWIKITDEFTASGLILPYTGSAATTAGNPAFRIQNSSAGNAISGEANGAGYGVFGYSNNGTGGYFSSLNGPALMTGTGNVGIGTSISNPPTFPLDVTGRIRLRNKPSETPGIWFEKISTPLAQSSFFGVLNDSIVGLYGTKDNNWKFFFNHDNNNFGIYNSNPRAPLSFQALVGNKIDFYYQSPTSMYGIGLQAAELQLYTNDNTAHTSIGYGSSTAFTETFRVNSGYTVTTNPVAAIPGNQASNYFKQGTTYTGAIKTIASFPIGSGARLGLFTNASSDLNALAERLTITNDGKVGIGLINATNPLSFPATLEKKISLYPGATGDVGLAVSGNELRIYSDNSNAVTTIGYDDYTNGFTENFRVVPDGSTVTSNPTTLAANVQNATYFKSGSYYTGAIKSIGTASNSARLGLFAFSTLVQNNLKEYVSVLDGGNVGINTITPNSKLQVEGSVSLPIKLLTGNYTATDNDYSLRYDAYPGGGSVTVTLPAAANRTGRIYVISASLPYVDAAGGPGLMSSVTINKNDGNTIFNDNPTLQDPDGIFYNVLMNFKPIGLGKKRKQSVTVQSDGSKWLIIGNDFQY